MAGIAAVVLAAGRSQRMGEAKLVMPWGDMTVIGRVVSVLAKAGVSEIAVVTGGNREAVEAALIGLPARCVYNPRYADDFMLLSLQTGVRALSDETAAFLVALGDQPQIDEWVVRRVVGDFVQCEASLVVPSFQRKRGHPWLVARPLWADLLHRTPPETMRSFLNAHADQIRYIEVETDSVLRDLDTPEDYQRERPI